MADQYGTHDDHDRKIVARKDEARPSGREDGKNSRDNGARYTGPGMSDRQLMNDNEGAASRPR